MTSGCGRRLQTVGHYRPAKNDFGPSKPPKDIVFVSAEEYTAESIDICGKCLNLLKVIELTPLRNATSFLINTSFRQFSESICDRAEPRVRLGMSLLKTWQMLT